MSSPMHPPERAGETYAAEFGREQRTTDQIHEAITQATTASPDYGELGGLWREMARAAQREKLPGWTVLAAALLADDYDFRARERHTGTTGESR
jgi:hypothetical protein